MSNEISSTTVNAYLETLLWSTTLSACDEDGNSSSITFEGEEYEDGTPLDQIPGCDSSDMPPEVVDSAREDLEGFRSYCLDSIGIDPFRFFDASQVAHDFCLSRNGQGAGFFDREYTLRGSINGDHDPDKSHSLSDELQGAAKTFGAHGLQVWVDESGELKIEEHS